MKEWHYNSGGGQSGPHTSSELQNLLVQGAILPSTLVWKQGMAGWLPLQQALPELVAALPPAMPPTSPPPVPAAVPPPAVAPAPPPPKKKGCLIALIILGIIGLICVVGAIVLAVALPPFLKSLEHNKALERRDAAVVALELPANILPPEVAGYRLQHATNMQALGWLLGDYRPVVAMGKDEGYDVRIDRFPNPEEAEKEAGRMLRNGVWEEPAKENGGYFFPSSGYDRHCYFTWSFGTIRIEIKTPKENEAKLRVFVTAYQAAAGVPPE